MRRIGIMGGTFDPPHIGHLVLAEYAAHGLHMESLLFVPAADPPHKRDDTRTRIEDRLAMVECAIAGNPRFVLSRVDVDRPGPHYTVDMVKIIQAEYPDAELFFVMGGDSLYDLPQWDRPQELIRLCRLAVMARPDFQVPPDMHESVLPGLAQRVEMIESPMLGFSSTDVVARMLAGKTVRYIVPQPVLEYIVEHKLYRGNHR